MSEESKKFSKMISCLNSPYIKENTLIGSSWCLGGVMGNCWDDSKIYIEGEEPLDFYEFDEMMTNLTPDVTFINYKKIRKECVKMESYYEDDYYGSSYEYARWICDISKLVKVCEKYGYKIKNN